MARGKYVMLIHFESDESLATLKSDAYQQTIVLPDTKIDKVQVSSRPPRGRGSRPQRGTRGGTFGGKNKV